MPKLSDADTLKLMRKYRIPYPVYSIVKTEDECVKKANSIGYPIALKIVSKDIVHKTESGGIEIGLENEKEVRFAFKKIMANVKRKQPRAKIDGVLVQQMISGHETIIGANYDSQFGPVIMFGLGGIFVEVMKDVTFRLIPVERKDVQEMIKEIKGYKILQGVRGEKAVNIKAIEDFLLKVSKMIEKEKKIKELDLNPVFVSSKGAVAVDARIII
ncbi:MAG: acetate--CoA ligase family protein [Nanoarchaeota archaeon]|nr:acetate--CoA ligase family protein [Nanoarchaeota archaeon]